MTASFSILPAVGAVAVEQIALIWARLVTDVAPHGEMAVRLHCSAFLGPRS
jgi:hypothetical protein